MITLENLAKVRQHTTEIKAALAIAKAMLDDIDIIRSSLDDIHEDEVDREQRLIEANREKEDRTDEQVADDEEDEERSSKEVAALYQMYDAMDDARRNLNDVVDYLEQALDDTGSQVFEAKAGAEA